jgi:antitoxin (DNA-binding transcriptional repressor) of toxin-antitoxin stability system
MKFVTVRDLRTNPARVWKNLGTEGELIVTSHGKPVALMTPLSEENFFNSLLASKRQRAMTAVTSMQKAAQQAGLDRLSMTEIDGIIRKARKQP